MECIVETETTAVLLDLSLPDSDGTRTLEELFKVAPEIPILVLGGENQEAAAAEAVSRGAQDYLLPDHLDSYSLPRALHSAIERKLVEDALYVEKERALVTLNSIGDAVLCTNVAGDITYMNLVGETMTGWSHQEALGQPLTTVFNIVDSLSRKRVKNPLEIAVRENRSVGLSDTCLLIRRDGFESAIADSASPIHDRKGRIIGAVIVFHDVTAERALSLQLIHAAQFDTLTNLPNRALLANRISLAISLARRQKASVAVLFLDLDHFKYINDSLGHAVGDKLLQSVAKRLCGNLRASDTICRQGGDEFIILLTQITQSEDAAVSAKKILLCLKSPHLIGRHRLHIDASIGSSVYPEDGEDGETLIQNADTAMYRAKEAGRNSYRAFKSEMSVEAVARQSLEERLRTAIGNNEFTLFYQPRVNLATGQITGLEALIRWQHPEHGLVPPMQFIPVAESCGLIVEIGRWVLREACMQALAWQTAGLEIPRVAVNVSATEMHHEGFIDGVREVLAESGLPGRFLEMEITERVLMDHAEGMASIFKDLKEMGIHLAIDDFGTGYSSLSYLHRFAVEILKIDRSFIQELGADSNDSAIVTAIIAMAKSLNFLVVAEGIETEAQKNYLETLHCTDGQGYLFSRPLPAAQISHLLEKNI
jgi:diguanylate cyclase (GGDEF)-like protein/PAS domain S-box-containing protein